MVNINVSYPDDGLGDKLRNAFIKVNDNFIELSNDIALKIGDAPSDGSIYVRKDGVWFEYEGAVTPSDIDYLKGLIDNLYDTKVDKVAGSRLITALEIAIINNQSGINTGDQDLSGLAPKHNPTFTGSVIVPNATNNNEAVALGQLNTILENLEFPADQVSYDNTASDLLAETVQEAIDELYDKKLDKIETGSTERVYAVSELNIQSMIPTMEQFVSDTAIISALEAITTSIAIISVAGKTMYKGQMYVSDSPAYIYLAYDDNQIIRK